MFYCILSAIKLSFINVVLEVRLGGLGFRVNPKKYHINFTWFNQVLTFIIVSSRGRLQRGSNSIDSSVNILNVIVRISLSDSFPDGNNSGCKKTFGAVEIYMTSVNTLLLSFGSFRINNVFYTFWLCCLKTKN